VLGARSGPLGIGRRGGHRSQTAPAQTGGLDCDLSAAHRARRVQHRADLDSWTQEASPNPTKAIGERHPCTIPDCGRRVPIGTSVRAIERPGAVGLTPRPLAHDDRAVLYRLLPEPPAAQSTCLRRKTSYRSGSVRLRMPTIYL
jgi:hypothetical protein